MFSSTHIFLAFDISVAAGTVGTSTRALSKFDKEITKKKLLHDINCLIAYVQIIITKRSERRKLSLSIYS